MAKEKFEGRMPNGVYTSKTKEFTDAWDDLINPIEEKYGVVCTSFDPGVTFVNSGNYASPFTLPVGFAKRLVENV